ncbi:uncharacterized protein LOC111008620 [Momordica charantia]|uniref:Uncharacterized protein LOC111008620 n=1 Tax=Momordica charantia TaxID=3673 RepID=A0A6J1C636_MOMCH|nr:uncharacterized protein LOC111008620 [Momordica charantia]
MAEENTGIPVAVETSGDEGSQDESFDIPVIAVAEISEPDDISEESIDDILAIPEENESERSSVEVIVDIDAPKIGRKIPSRYLLPYAGSCHDFCKYGTKHPLEGKPASLVLKKVITVGGDGRDSRRTMISLAKQNKDPINTKSSPDYNAMNNTDSKEDIIYSPEIVILSPKRLLPSSKEMQAAAVHYSRTKLNLSHSKRSSFSGQGSSGTKRNKEVQEGQELDGDGSISSRTNSSTSRCQEIDIFEEEDMKALVPQAISRSPRNHGKRVAVADKKVTGRRRLKNRSHPMKTKLVHCKNEDVEEKTLYMIEPSTKNEAEELAQNSVHTTDLSRPKSSSAEDNGLKHDQEADGTSKVPQSVEKIASRARNGTSSKNLFTSSSVSRGSKGLRPKRYGMIQRSKIQSAPSSSSLSRYPAEPVHGEHGGRPSGKDVKKSEHSKVEHKIKTRRTTVYDSENGDFQSRKLKPRKGRLVELQPENNSPRRPKFLSDTENGDSQSRKLKLRKGRLVELQPENNSLRGPKFLSDSENGDSQSRKLKLRKGRLVELQPENNSPRSPKFLSDSENGDVQSRKLKFREGRLVELQPENNAPRRLKFRRARLLGETQTQSPKSDSRRRNFQGKEANQNGNQNGDEAKETEHGSSRQQDQETKRKKSFRRKETIDSKFVSARTKSERVVLRHQDSRGKKEIQNLFNNVIEETASKLAQTRKSKVKALVGAFETVISLQDTRPSATVT